MFNINGLYQAQEVVARAMPATPQYRWPGLCQRAGCEVWIKHENHTPTGAFKVRGGLVLLDDLVNTGEVPAKIITATRGNHGQSIPFAAVRCGVEGAMFLPPFHPALVRGVATYAMELFAAVPDLDVVYVPVGMGSGICALIQTRDLLGLTSDIVGVVAERAPSMARSFAAGRIVASVPASSCRAATSMRKSSAWCSPEACLSPELAFAPETLESPGQ